MKKAFEELEKREKEFQAFTDVEEKAQRAEIALKHTNNFFAKEKKIRLAHLEKLENECKNAQARYDAAKAALERR